MKKPDWKTKEEIVALLEKAISPNAIVKHNIELPDLFDPTVKRQFDTVIYSDNSNRATLTVVEVQDRGNPMSVNIFEGFIPKMESVGAQRLICVTKSGYQQGVLKTAKKYGPRVILLTLSEIESSDFPINFIGDVVVFANYKIVAMDELQINIHKGDIDSTIRKRIDEHIPINFESNDKVFSYREELVCINDIIDEYRKSLQIDLPTGQSTISIDTKKLQEKLYIIQSDKIIQCRLKFNATYEKTEKLIPLKYSEYKQIELDGVDAWMIDGTGVFKENEESIKVAFIPIKDSPFFTAKIIETPKSLKNFVASFTEIK